ncbi:unnamed protein product [Urochloa humidicola]
MEIGGGSGEGGSDRTPREQSNPNPSVADLLQKLNLTAEEGDVADFSDDEDQGEDANVEWVLLGKAISPSTLHAATIRSAMTPAWGNPHGMKIRSIGEKGDNLFVVEFGSKVDMDRVLAGSPWITGKHAILLKEYDEKLKPSEIRFDCMEIWVRLLNLPLGWMNQHRGIRAMRLLGEVKKMDVDGDGKASGAFLRARIAIEINKPIKRGVLLRMTKDGEPEWFNAQYEKLPFFCFSCGLLGHGGLECMTPAQKNSQGKLPYERDIPLRAPDDRRKKLQSFVEAAAESFGSGPYMGSRPARATSDNSSGRHTETREKEVRRSGTNAVGPERDTGEVTSSLKRRAPAEPKEKEMAVGNINRQLFHGEGGDGRKQVKKRKSKRSGPTSSQTPDLNLPAEEGGALVPAGLVSARMSQLTGARETAEGFSRELPKKQKTLVPNTTTGSAAAASDSPRREQ